jgi:hypothetical protein
MGKIAAGPTSPGIEAAIVDPINCAMVKFTNIPRQKKAKAAAVFCRPMLKYRIAEYVTEAKIVIGTSARILLVTYVKGR